MATAALLMSFAFAACATLDGGADWTGGDPPAPVAPVGPVLTVAVVDVGQGDGILIRSPAGKTVLIDAGDRGAERALLAQLAADGVTALDLVIMTHPHADHIGGMQKVLEAVPARLFLDPGFDHASGVYARLLEHLERAGTRVLLARAPRRIDLGGGAALEVLAPSEPLLAGTRSDVNANSVVVKLIYGVTTMLFTGDSEEPTERRLLADPAALAADILKVAHHGSANSTYEPFLTAVHPRLAVISCGVDNRFHHPAPAALARLERAGVAVLRTDLHGTVTLTSDGAHWSAAVARGDAAGVDLRGAVPVAPRPPPTELSGPRAPPAPALAPAPALTSTLPDLNAASAAALNEVEGIGPTKAAAIVAYREAHGPFASIEALIQVPGIGPKIAARIGERFAVYPPQGEDLDTP